MIELNGRAYAPPRKKTVVFCVDGSAPAYIDLALADGLMPRLGRALAGGGLHAQGLGQMPSFTNPNNVTIVTGVSAAQNGIDRANAFEKFSPIDHRDQTHAHDDIANGYVRCALAQ